ncbi:MAG: RNA polymerase sigma factor [Faecousia sp.]
MATQEKAEGFSDGQFSMHGLYQKYSNFLYKLAWQYGADRYDVEELVQCVWLRLCEKADVLASLSSERQLSYIATTLRNTAISLSRTNKVEWSLEMAENICYNESDMLAVLMDRKLRTERFREIWPQVPVDARELLERKYFLMESDKEIASVMGIRPNSVRTYLSRARKIAYTILAEYKEEIE